MRSFQKSTVSFRVIRSLVTSLIVVLTLVLASPVVLAQQVPQDEPSLIDRLAEDGHLEDMSPEMLRRLVGHNREARRALPHELRSEMQGRRHSQRASWSQGASRPVQADLSDLTIEEAVQGIGSAPWPVSELNFTPSALPSPAGDVNGDGTDDWVYRIPTADERTDDLSDRVTKTFLRYGGGDFSARFHDRLHYRPLVPVGNLVGGANADAIQFIEIGARIFEGTSNGYAEVATRSLDFGLGDGLRRFNNPADVDGDGHDDLLFIEDEEVETPEFRVLFGADDPSGLEVRSYSQPFDGFKVFSYQVGDHDGDDHAEIVRLAGNQAEGDTAVTVEVFEIDGARSLNVGQSFSSGEIGSADSFQPPALANLDGSGLSELVVPNRLTVEDTSLVFTGDPDNPGQYDSTAIEYPPTERHIGDVNGDGRADFWREPETGPVIALGAENVSDGFASELEVPLASEGEFLSFLRNPDRAVMGDLDGDDRDEFIAESGLDSLGAVQFDVTDGSVQREGFPIDESFQRKNVLQTQNVGDWNGDGDEDVAFLRSNGKIEIYYEDPTTSITPNLTIDRSESFGPTLSTPDGTGLASGDFTGNGNPNLAVGWPSHTETVEVYEAGAGTDPIRTLGVSDLGLDPANVRQPDGLRPEVANVGDANDDGTEDFLVTLPSDFFNEVTQQAFLFLGQDPLPEQVDVTIDYRDELPPDASIFILGSQIQALGDVNDDGIDDFGVADIQGFNPGVRGRIYVHYGQSGGADSLDFSTPDVLIQTQPDAGEDLGFFPWGMASGDFNDDGVPDVAAKPLTHFSGSSEGIEAIRIYHGGSDFDSDPEEKYSIPAGPFSGRSGNRTFSDGTLTTVPQDGGPDRVMVETADFGVTNALIFADEGSGFEPTRALRAPDQGTHLGAPYRAINWPTPSSSAIGDFTGGGQTRLLLPHPTPNFRDGPSYTFQLGTGSESEEPIISVTESVDADTTAGSTVTFEGTGTSVTFSDSTTGSGDVTVDRFDSAPSGATGIDGNISEYRVEITASGDLTVGDSSEVRFDVSAFGGISNPGAVTIYSREIGGLGSFIPLETSHDEESDELVGTASDFSEFAFGSQTDPLPVDLAEFDATVDDGAVRLTWQTASETANARFEVQRRLGEREKGREGAWTTVGSVEGAGTTTEARSYRFTDADLPYAADRLTYRLRQIDTDGSAQPSETVTVERGVDEVELLGTYPNPAQSRATVRYALPEKQDVTVRLYDMLGRQVRTVVQAEKEGRHERQLNTSGLSSGVYFLRLQSDGQTRTQKLMVVR